MDLQDGAVQGLGAVLAQVELFPLGHFLLTPLTIEPEIAGGDDALA